MDRNDVLILRAVSFLCLFFLCACHSGHSHSSLAPEETDNLVVGNYVLISKVRSGETSFDYTFKASISNIGEKDAKNATATLTSNVSSTVIIHGELTFGDVPAGETVASSDTFTVRIDRSIEFNQDDLIWDIQADFTTASSAEYVNGDLMNTAGTTEETQGEIPQSGSDMSDDQTFDHVQQ